MVNLGGKKGHGEKPQSLWLSGKHENDERILEEKKTGVDEKTQHRTTGTEQGGSACLTLHFWERGAGRRLGAPKRFRRTTTK